MRFKPSHPVAGGAFLRRLAVIGLLLLTLGACQKPPAPDAALLAQGQSFPTFVLDFMSSRSAGMPSWQGKTVVLNVWATWCPPCRREMPDLQRLSQTLDPQRFAVLGLSIDQDTLLAQEFLRQHGITFTNYFDQGGTVMRPLDLPAYPQTFVIAPDRTLLRRMTGLQAWASPEMVSLLEELDRTQPRTGQGFAGGTARANE